MTDTSTRPTETLHRSRSAARALLLLDTVITGGPMGLAEAADAVDLPTSTALRHLRALQDSGYLARDEFGRYAVGPTFLRIALAAFQSGPYARLVAAAQPELERVAALTEETAYVAVRDGTEAVYIATVESPRAIRHVGWVGRSVPIDGTAVGAALLAPAPEPGDRPVVEVNTGAIEPDVTAVCAPIHGGGGGAVVGALSVLGPADRLAGTRLTDAGEAVVDAAVTIASALSAPVEGGRPR